MVRFGAQRPRQTRNPLPIIIIARDDSKTAPAYFGEIRGLMKHRCSIRVVPASRDGATAKDVIECASNARSKLSDPDGTNVWATLDLEMASNSNSLIIELRAAGKLKSVEIAFSQPCSEVWVLAHFADTGELFGNCRAVIRKVCTSWKAEFKQEFTPKKAQADYRKLSDKMTVAISNATKHSVPHSQSWTEIWRVVEPLV